jgi:D-beta-D-heptose 7-phosphate kinase/D-beta-D-heptose 1-phosphate adenosyltransferase
LRKALAKLDAMVAELVIDQARPTTRKVRFVSEHYSTHPLRADWETAAPASAESQAAIIAHAEAAMAKAGAVVLSDYAKGVLSERVIRTIIDAARRHGTPVIVDQKGHDYRVYRGATLITPNAKELAAAVHRSVRNEAEIAAAAAELAHMVGSEAVLITRSEEGMSLHVEGQPPIHIPAYPVEVRDVSGAGDTVAAVMAVLAAMRTPYEFAMRAANAAAAVVVGKQAPRPCHLLNCAIAFCRPLRSRHKKIVFDWSVLDEHLQEWRRHGLRIGFTNGGFDLLHRGHVKLLAEARGASIAWCGIEQQRLDRAAQGRGTSDQPGGRPRRGAGRARSGRSGRGVRGRHAARTNQARASGCAGEGRRLSHRPGGRPRRG